MTYDVLLPFVPFVLLVLAAYITWLLLPRSRSSKTVNQREFYVPATPPSPIDDVPKEDSFLELAHLRQLLAAETSHADELNTMLLANMEALAHERRINNSLRGRITVLKKK